MSNTKKAPKPNMEELQAAMQALIEQGKKDGVIKATDLNALLEKMDLNAEKIESIYDGIEAMNIQIVTADLELDLGDDLDLVDPDGDLDLSALDDEDLVDPVDLAAEYSLDDPVRMYLKETAQNIVCQIIEDFVGCSDLYYCVWETHEHLRQVMVFREDLCRLFKEDFSGWGECNFAAKTVKQLGFKLLLQLGNILAHGRLRHAQHSGSSGKASL